MLPYDGMTRTGSKGVSHSVIAETPSEAARYWKGEGKASYYAGHGCVAILRQ